MKPAFIILILIFILFAIVNTQAQIKKFPKLERISISSNLNLGSVLNDDKFERDSGIIGYQAKTIFIDSLYHYIANGTNASHYEDLGIIQDTIDLSANNQISYYSLKTYWLIDKTKVNDYISVGLSRIKIIDRKVTWIAKENYWNTLEIGDYFSSTFERYDFQTGLEINYNVQLYSNKWFSILTGIGTSFFLSSDSYWQGQGAYSFSGYNYNIEGEIIGIDLQSAESFQKLHSMKSKVAQLNALLKIFLLPEKRINGIIAYNYQYGIQDIGRDASFNFRHWINKQYFEFGLTYRVYNTRKFSNF